MTLRRKILFGFGGALLLLAITLAWAVWNIVHLGQASDAILRENYKSILAAENMIDAIERQDSATLLVILNYDEEGLRQFRENEAQFLQWLGRARDNITIEGEKEIIDRIDSGYADYLARFSDLQGTKNKAPGDTGKTYHESVLPVFSAVRDACTNLRDLNQQTMFDASKRAEILARTAFVSTLGIGAAALLIGLGYSLVLSGRLVRPLRDMLDASHAIAEGKYEVSIPAESRDELGRLADGFNAMAGRLALYHRLNVEKVVAEKRKADAVLRSIEDGIVVVDADLKVSEINPTAARILGTDDESVGRHVLEMIRNDKLFGYLRDAAEKGISPRLEGEKAILTTGHGDNERHYLFAVTPVHGQGEARYGAVLLLRDVTRLQEVNRLKSEFVMTASHELRTPLQSITMSMNLLKERARDRFGNEDRELLDTSLEELHRLTALINDLLDLSKLEAGKIGMDMDSVEAGLLVDKALSVIGEQARNRNITLSAEISNGLPKVRADANKIVWVLTNLLSNALRYVDGGGRITVVAEAAGNWLYLSVRDNGPGIPAELQSRIFEKFVQADSPKSVGGTGLGLAICREIVRAHKGTIWVESKEGEGATFTFALPVVGPCKREETDEYAKNTDR
jgi:NtrC-family two-component system sensor histidine kinase KinB